MSSSYFSILEGHFPRFIIQEKQAYSNKPTKRIKKKSGKNTKYTPIVHLFNSFRTSPTRCNDPVTRTCTKCGIKIKYTHWHILLETIIGDRYPLFFFFGNFLLLKPKLKVYLKSKGRVLLSTISQPFNRQWKRRDHGTGVKKVIWWQHDCLIHLNTTTFLQPNICSLEHTNTNNLIRIA